MSIKPGEHLPAGSFQTLVAGRVETLSTDDVFAGKKVVLFAVPGAFTPTCSDTHLPGFLARVEEFEARGIDTIACLAVNDAFVVDAWRKIAGVERHLLMLADGNGDYTRALGLELDATGFGMGIRSRRFAALVDDGVVRVLKIENGPGVDVSSAESILAALDGSP